MVKSPFTITCDEQGYMSDEEVFKLAKEITQESSLYVTGTITEDNRSDLGYEMQVKSIEVISEAHDYPITPKIMVQNS